MANNFREIGDWYISKTGNDGNSGLTPDLPKRTLLTDYTAAGDLIVVGSGLYQEDIGKSLGQGGHIYEGDGLVVFNGNGIYEIINGGAAGGLSQIFINIIITNYSVRSSNNARTYDFRQCLIENVLATTSTHLFTCNQSILINVNFSNASSGASILSSIFISSSVFSSIFKNNYVDIDSVIKCTNISPSNFRNNNIQGTILLDATKYAIQDQLIGTPQDNGYAVGVDWLTEANLTTNGYSGTISGWDIAVSTCFNRDPQFNNVSKLDFSINTNSPHFQNAENAIDNIGGTNVGQGFYGTDDEWNISMEALQDANITGISDRILASGTSGKITSAPIQTPGGILLTPIVINYVGALIFDSDEAGGTSGNQNVPDSINYNSGDAGRNPNRLSYEMRWTTSATKPTQDSDWTNGGYISAGTWANFEWNQQPRIDNLGRGNGDASYNQLNNQSIEFIWYQVRVTLRNNYASL